MRLRSLLRLPLAELEQAGELRLLRGLLCLRAGLEWAGELMLLHCLLCLVAALAWAGKLMLLLGWQHQSGTCLDAATCCGSWPWLLLLSRWPASPD